MGKHQVIYIFVITIKYDLLGKEKNRNGNGPKREDTAIEYQAYCNQLA
jgi:hypothetical protein